MPYVRQRIRDPLHNLIEFEAKEFDNVLWRVIQTTPFQRLRRIRQLGFTEFVFPGATHSRFAHSIGVFHVARRLMSVVSRHVGETGFSPTSANAALAAALVHDLGHGPFSHAFEDVGRRLGLRMANHENVSEALIKDGEVADALKGLGSGFPNDVAGVLTRERPTMYDAVVSSQFDADRLDYMQRDRLMSGTELGGIDFEWILANLEVASLDFGVDETPVGKVETFVVGTKALRAVEAYVLGLFQLYPTVYFHKTARGAEKLFGELLYRVVTLVRGGSVSRTGLPSRHPIIAFARKPESLQSVLCLDDSVVWGSLSQMAGARDKVVRELAQRLWDRKLYKAVDVRARLMQKLGSQDQEAVDKACAEVVLKIEEWRSKHRDEQPRVLVDQTERTPYRKFQDSKGPINQIMVRTAGGGLADIGEQSEVLHGLQTFRLFRVYVRSEDDEARRLVETMIREEMERGTQH